MKNKPTAVILAFLLGGLGVHKFYLGKPLQGFLYLIFCWTFIPAFIGFLEAIIWAFMSEDDFNERFNASFRGAIYQSAAQTHQAAQSNRHEQSIVVNVASPSSNSSQPSGGDVVVGQLKSLHDLKLAGALSEEEYNSQKARILTGRN